jgi:sugar-specific transcriptional regulator TrmB
MTIKEILKKLDLSDKEITTYLALLELGNETHIFPISRKAKLPRTTVFHVLDRLHEEGLVSVLDRHGRRIYSPTPPEQIVKSLEKRHAELGEQVAAVKSSLPELLKLFAISDYQPKVKVYQGEEIREIYEELLNSSEKEQWYIGGVKPIEDLLGKRYLADWIKRRIAAGIASKAIRTRSTETPDTINSNSGKEFMREVRYAPEGFNLGAHVIIAGNKIAMITTAKESYGILIDSRDIATTMKSWFTSLWNQLEPPKN